MYTLIRSALLSAFVLCLASPVFAGGGKSTPAHIRFNHFDRAARTVDSFLSASIKMETASNTSAKICSCQILNLESSNYDHRHVAVFAEKTDHGTSGEMKYAGQRIEKEKKQLKKMFYNKVSLVKETTSMTSCSALFVQLKSADQNLQLYDILNADINF